MTNYLIHYGVKGMKWRNRKASYEDTYTEEQLNARHEIAEKNKEVINNVDDFVDSILNEIGRDTTIEDLYEATNETYKKDTDGVKTKGFKKYLVESIKNAKIHTGQVRR